jgi:hypothetical protein
VLEISFDSSVLIGFFRPPFGDTPFRRYPHVPPLRYLGLAVGLLKETDARGGFCARDALEMGLGWNPNQPA